MSLFISTYRFVLNGIMFMLATSVKLVSCYHLCKRERLNRGRELKKRRVSRSRFPFPYQAELRPQWDTPIDKNIVLLFVIPVDTPQTVYKVPICPGGNLLYIKIYFTNNNNNKEEKKPKSLQLSEYLAQH